MGLFGKLFGGDFASRRAEGDAHFEAGRWGEAKLEYELAVAKATEVPALEVDTVRERIGVCRARLTERHIEEAHSLAAAGMKEEAYEHLATAEELAPTPELEEAVAKQRDDIERAEARAGVAEEEVTDDELYAVLSGTWEEDQLDEYESCGEALRTVVLLLHDGKGDEALPKIEPLLATAEDPCYLHFEHGRALLQADRKEEGAVALRKFLETLEPEEGGRVRAGAHDALARLAVEAGDDAGAEVELRACAEALPEAVEPLVLLARFMRRRKRDDEALEFAEAGVERMGSLRPYLPAIRELGLALDAKGEKERALGVLESAVEIYAANDDFDFDPEFAVTLARLTEEAGDPKHAADFYRHLAAGSDKKNHFTYNFEAGRLLQLAGMSADARRYLARALELAADDEARSRIEERIKTLGG